MEGLDVKADHAVDVEAWVISLQILESIYFHGRRSGRVRSVRIGFLSSPPYLPVHRITLSIAVYPIHKLFLRGFVERETLRASEPCTERFSDEAHGEGRSAD